MHLTRSATAKGGAALAGDPGVRQTQNVAEGSMIKHALRTAVLVSVTLAGSASAAKELPACAVTEATQAKPPDDPNADPFGYGPWQINQDRTIWATWGMDRLK